MPSISPAAHTRAIRTSGTCTPLQLTPSKRLTRRVAQWLIFSDTWNAIVDELRSKDLLSEKEKRNLNFQHLPIDDTVEVRCGCGYRCQSECCVALPYCCGLCRAHAGAD